MEKQKVVKFDCDFEELFHWLALNADIRRFVIEYIPFSVGQPSPKEWALFLEVPRRILIDLSPWKRK